MCWWLSLHQGHAEQEENFQGAAARRGHLSRYVCAFLTAIIIMKMRLVTCGSLSERQLMAHGGMRDSFCLTSTETRLFIRDGDGGAGGGGEEGVEARLQVPMWMTKDAVDHHQNNKNVTAVFPHHCAATSVLCICCLSCCAEQSQRQCP